MAPVARFWLKSSWSRPCSHTSRAQIFAIEASVSARQEHSRITARQNGRCAAALFDALHLTTLAQHVPAVPARAHK